MDEENKIIGQESLISKQAARLKKEQKVFTWQCDEFAWPGDFKELDNFHVVRHSIRTEFIDFILRMTDFSPNGKTVGLGTIVERTKQMRKLLNCLKKLNIVPPKPAV